MWKKVIRVMYVFVVMGLCTGVVCSDGDGEGQTPFPNGHQQLPFPNLRRSLQAVSDRFALPCQKEKPKEQNLWAAGSKAESGFPKLGALPSPMVYQAPRAWDPVPAPANRQPLQVPATFTVLPTRPLPMEHRPAASLVSLVPLGGVVRADGPNDKSRRIQPPKVELALSEIVKHAHLTYDLSTVTKLKPEAVDEMFKRFSERERVERVKDKGISRISDLVHLRQFLRLVADIGSASELKVCTSHELRSEKVNNGIIDDERNKTVYGWIANKMDEEKKIKASGLQCLQWLLTVAAVVSRELGLGGNNYNDIPIKMDQVCERIEVFMGLERGFFSKNKADGDSVRNAISKNKADGDSVRNATRKTRPAVS